MKKCTKCSEEKQIDQFYTDKRATDGHQSSCKKCHYDLRKPRDHKKEWEREKAIRDKDKKAQSMRIWRQNNKDHRREYARTYDTSHRELVNKNKYRRHKERLEEDSLYKFREITRQRTRKELTSRNIDKTQKTDKYLGCTYKEGRDHLTSLFQPGMTWDNHGEWHIDYIIPLGSAKTKEELEPLFHYTNLQPLWAEDNLKKGAKITKA